MKKLLTYAVVIGTIVWSLGLGVSVQAASAAYVPTAGDVIKVNAADRPAVYIVGSDLKTYVFSTRNTYGSYYYDFSLLKNISQADFDEMTMGGNITVRPGSLIKFDNSNNAYAVVPGNKLCKLATDADAKILYGNDYAARVLMIQVSFVSNYTVDPSGALTKDSKLPDGTLIQYAGSPKTIYYIENGQKKLVSDEAFIANSLGTAIIVENVPTTMIYENGASITGKNAALSSVRLTNSSVTAPITEIIKNF